MARFFGNPGDALNNASFPATASTGSVSVWLRPHWSSGDGNDHVFWCFAADGSHAAPTFQKYLDNNIYCGFTGFGAGEQRIIIADTGLFTANVWAHWLFTWNNGGTHKLYKNGVLVGSRATSTPNAQTGLTVGDYQTLSLLNTCNTDIGELTYWTAELTADEAGYLGQGGRSTNIRTASLADYYPITGIDSPELDKVGGFNLNLQGSTVQATNPPLVDFTPPPDVTFGPPNIYSPYGQNLFVEPDAAQSVQSVPPVVILNVNPPEVFFGPPFPGAPWQTYTENHDVPGMTAATAPTFCCPTGPDIVFGPPVPGFPWQTYTEADQTPNPAAPAPPGVTPNLWLPDITFGPNVPGAPWQTYTESDDRQFIPGPGVPAVLPKVAGKPFLERVPDIKGPSAQERLRRHTEMLANVINSLSATGQLVQTGSTQWKLYSAGIASLGLTGTFSMGNFGGITGSPGTGKTGTFNTGTF